MTPLIDMFVILVVFLIMSFSASGDFQLSSDIELPRAETTDELERAPIVQISANTIAIEGVKVGSSEELLRKQDLRIAALTDKLSEIREVDELMHGRELFRGELIINGGASQRGRSTSSSLRPAWSTDRSRSSPRSPLRAIQP